MTTKQYLQRAYNLRRRIAAKESHLEELRAQAEHITPDLSGMPHGSGVGDPTANIAAQIADLDMEIHLDWLDLIQYQDEITRTIEAVADPNAYQVLSYRYLSFKSWHEIADLMHYSIRWVFKIHAKALKIVEEDIERQ